MTHSINVAVKTRKPGGGAILLCALPTNSHRAKHAGGAGANAMQAIALRID
jgi:hypothetical protein